MWRCSESTVQRFVLFPHRFVSRFVSIIMLISRLIFVMEIGAFTEFKVMVEGVDWENWDRPSSLIILLLLALVNFFFGLLVRDVQTCGSGSVITVAKSVVGTGEVQVKNFFGCFGSRCANLWIKIGDQFLIFKILRDGHWKVCVFLEV